MATTKHEIDKQLDMPMYHQLYLILKDQIRSGVYEEGKLIPSEAKLQSEFGVSRITVRRAISELEIDGYVQRKKGKGSIVMTREKYRDIFAFKSFSDDTKDKGETPGSVVLEIKRIKANNQVSRALNIKPGEEVLFLKRLRLMSGRVVALHDTFVNLNHVHGLEDEKNNTSLSLYEYYETHGVELSHAEETIEVMMPSPDIQQHLFISSHEPVFYRERITYDTDGHAIEFSQNHYRGDRFKYALRMEKTDNDQK